MRRLFYRVVAARAWPTRDGYFWEAYLLIQGHGKPIKGTIVSLEELGPSMQDAIARAYEQVTRTPLPRPDGQLPLPL